MMEERLEKIIKSYAPRLIQSVCESVRIPSIVSSEENGFPYGVEVARAAEHAMQCAGALGFSVTDLDGRVCWADYGEGDETVAVMGHLDVVPPGEGWQFEAFSGTVKNGYILGRGTQDDKGPLFSSLYALKAIADYGEPLSKKVRIIFGMDEESGKMRDVIAYLAAQPAPVYAFTPDGAYPVVNTEKGTIKFKSTIDYSNDSSPVKLEAINGGESLGSVPRLAQAWFSGKRSDLETFSIIAAKRARERNWNAKIEFEGDRLKISVVGKAAHATLPELGENAIGRLAILIAQPMFAGKAGSFIAFLASAIGVEPNGASLGIAGSHPHCGKITVNLAMLEGDDRSLTVTCGIYIPAQTISFDRACAVLRSAFSEAGGTFDPFMQAAPLFYPADHPLIRRLQRGYENATGKPPSLVSMCGGTYSKRMPNMVPFGATFDDEDDRAHGANERLLISNLLESYRIMTYALLELAK